MRNTSRSEEEIFNDLSKLCLQPGYIHVIAFLCFRDNTIRYDETIEAKDMLHQFSMDRLLRTEFSTLIGLLIKQEIDFTLPDPDVIQSMFEKTDSLLKEIHVSMSSGFFSEINQEKIKENGFNPFANAVALREPIFYGGESAYLFQYRALAQMKYEKETDWFIRNKGYTPKDACMVIECISNIQNKKILNTLDSLKRKHPNNWSILPAFSFTASEISNLLGEIENDKVKLILDSFSPQVDANNENFTSISEFNLSNAYPVIKHGQEEYILFLSYSLAEAYYETPFFWFNEDESYAPTAMKHRGEFTEAFSEERLQHVFGKENVFSNVDIIDSKGDRAGEIDVLVVFSNRAIILQAKSKKLTIASRKGNDNCIKDDFKKAIQDSYDQGYSCASLIENSEYKLCFPDLQEISINRQFKEIYIFCVVSDHYPALSFQSRQFLEFHQSKNILPPFIMDVFLLDVMTEMLSSPLQFLSYVNRRVAYADRVMATHELTILSHHLKHNLWISGERDLFYLSEGISADLDIAMMVRREGLKGADTPDGILTRFQGTTLGDLICQIEKLEDPGTIDLGFMLLLLSEETMHQVSNKIDKIARRAVKDGKCHDLTIGIGGGSTGLTVHCNNEPIHVAWPRLKRHAEKRKYIQKAKNWFGICVVPKTKQLLFGLELSYEWEQSDDMDRIISDLNKPQRTMNLGTKYARRKIGRNEKCPCGSGKKYKQCCSN